MLSVISAVVLSSCKRYKENNGLQLRTADYRVRGTYQISQYIVNGIDSTQFLIGDRKLSFVHDKHDPPVITGYNEGGWRFSNGKKNILIEAHDKPYNANFIFVRINEELSWRIYKLTSDEMKIKTSYNNSDYEILFTKLSQL